MMITKFLFSFAVVDIICGLHDIKRLWSELRIDPLKYLELTEKFGDLIREFQDVRFSPRFLLYHPHQVTHVDPLVRDDIILSRFAFFTCQDNSFIDVVMILL